MKKQLLLLLLVVAFAVKASAQTKSEGMKLNIAAEGALPVGDGSDIYSFGLGVSGKLEVPAATSLNVTFTTGVTTMMIKDDIKQLLAAFGDNSSSRTFVPLEIGLRYYVNPKFYAEAQSGAAIGTKSGVGTAFAYSPGIGLVFPSNDGNAFDLGFRYEAWSKNGSTLGFMGLRVAYKFGL